METKLTNDSDYLLCALYKEYRRRRKEGINKADSKKMGSSKDIHESLMKKWCFEDVEETCRELSRAGFLKIFFADNIAYIITLSDDAVIYMENRFSNGLQGVLDRMEQIKNIIF